MAADVEDLARKGKEKVAELPKVTKKRGGSGIVGVLDTGVSRSTQS
jgi:hypothetical protein